MKRVFSSFVQKRIKPISSGTEKNGKNQAEKNALEKTANLVKNAALCCIQTEIHEWCAPPVTTYIPVVFYNESTCILHLCCH